MDKRYVTPIELLQSATAHAYAAEQILTELHAQAYHKPLKIISLSPVTSMLCTAFQLTFKAYILHEQGTLRHYKSMMELVDANPELGLSEQDRLLLKTLSRQQSFAKGVDHQLWDDAQQLQIFCEQLFNLYVRVQEVMPLELHSIYNE